MVIQDELAYDIVFVGIPKIMLELNVTRWFKLSADVGYRYVSGVDSRSYLNENGVVRPFYRNKDFNSPFIGLSLMFGGFKQ